LHPGEEKKTIKKKNNEQNEDSPDTSDNEVENEDSLTIDSGSLLSFAPEHPLEATHGVCWLSDKKKLVSNFIGPTLPRPDQGDRDYYCSAMLTIFKAWRTEHDLQHEMET
jgi:hypothetical protein